MDAKTAGLQQPSKMNRTDVTNPHDSLCERMDDMLSNIDARGFNRKYIECNSALLTLTSVEVFPFLPADAISTHAVTDYSRCHSLTRCYLMSSLFIN